MGSQFLSDLLGWVSIGCWLGAQFPQVLENIKRQSCEGLALPFLCNWLLGDITNLVGCLLTHQLPFQTWLAAYFCFVDFTLFSQYFYYGFFRTRATLSPSLLDSDRIAPYDTYSRKHSDHTNYRALSNAAAHIAVAAARAAEEEEGGQVTRRSIYDPMIHKRGSSSTVHRWTRHPTDEPLTITTAVVKPEVEGRGTSSEAREEEYNNEEDDEVDEDALAALADSFHSDGGKTMRRKRISWSQERSSGTSGVRGGTSLGRSTSRTRTSQLSPLTPLRPSLVLATHSDLIDPSSMTARGRPLQRQVADSPTGDLELDIEGGGVRTTNKVSLSGRRSSRASARLVFLGVWALFGVGTLVGSKGGAGRASVGPPTGTILSRDQTHSTYSSHPADRSVSVSDTFDSHSHIHVPHIAPNADSLSTVLTLSSPTDDDSPQYSGPSSEKVLGRISAWICTTLYLTSRLPQIWKNFVRKSVAGLSILLFVFAFLGNFFYVFSILTSPNMDLPRAEARAYLMESVPYLLGSGGTLMFDITIVVQSLLYRGEPPQKHYSGVRSRSHSHSHSYTHTGTYTRSNTNARNSKYSSRSFGFGTGVNTADAVRKRSRSRSVVNNVERDPLLSPRIGGGNYRDIDHDEDVQLSSAATGPDMGAVGNRRREASIGDKRVGE